MFGIFTRGRLYQNLTPAERAFLRMLELVVIGALVAGYQAVAPLLSTADPSAIPWPSVLHTFLSAMFVAVTSGALKYAKSFGDPPLPNAGAAPAAAPAAPASMPVTEPAGGGAEPSASA